MQKKNILNLIKYHSENNESGFRTEAYEIAKYFDKIGDYQLAEYVMALMSNTNTFVPQASQMKSSFFRKIDSNSSSLPLPQQIKDDIVGIINAIGHNVGVNKFLFEGAPGTGKTETVKQIARILDRELFSVEFDVIIDSRLGQTSKNISSVFQEIRDLPQPERAIILFDEIDALALDRVNSNDLREMGRATSSILKEFDNLDERVVLIATTNMFKSFDKALIRRFDSIINFNRYTKEDLIEISSIMLSELLERFKYAGRNMKFFKKIISLMEEIPYPGELKNMIKTALAFSDPNNEFDYLKKLFYTVKPDCKNASIKDLQEYGFTLREIEILTGVSKSQASRELKED
ncbi:MAG: ATP-binding protein [Anaerorhabdus sp.]|uniref:ATP-binding protein n=1 Tax=Anaerorhabdus sp. TaxID=1872524 RepID=UPI002B36BC60|nr:ATP-binding protein [Erysipelotrichales bacterium]